MKNYKGEEVVCVNENDLTIVKVGDVIKSRDSEHYEVMGLIPPHKPGSTGKIYVKKINDNFGARELYASVFDCKFIPTKEIKKMNYETISDAKTALENSGVHEWFSEVENMNQVYEWMWRNNKTPIEAADYFGVE